MLLTHSIRIKRLDLEKATPAASADADFSKLAYYDQNEDRLINGGNPFVSDTVCSKPFEQAITLRPGVHLHFVLPQALTHYYDDPAQILPAPNRWMIKKLKGQKVEHSWVLESDCLTDSTDINGQVNTILPVDLNRDGYRVFKETTLPFRYMGRLIPAAEYFSSNYKAGKEYWEEFMSEGEMKRPFTAFAYGNLNFASFYPNCHSVFGFHDLEGLPEHQYQVYGWHVEAEKDSSSAYLTRLQNFANSDPAPGPAEWENEFGIALPDTDHLKKAKQLLYFGKSHTPDTPFEPGNVKLALGNDVEEALSAFVAQEVKPQNAEAQRKLENQLEAIQFKLLGTRDLDLKPTFEARRHARTFQAHQGNALLGLTLYSPEKAAKTEQRQKQLWQLEQEIEQDQENQGALWLKELRQKIQQANALWLQYNEQQDQIESRQQLLHAHWQKYLEAAHPPLGMAYLLPDPNDVLVFLRDKSIAELRGLMQQNGLLKVHRKGSKEKPEEAIILDIAEDDQWGAEQKKISQPWIFEATEYAQAKLTEDNLALGILQLLKEIKSGLIALNGLSLLTEHSSEFVLKFELGQRFFEPGMPTLLLASDKFKENQLAQEDAEDVTADSGLVTLGFTDASTSFRKHLKSILEGSTPAFMAELLLEEEVRHPAYMDWGLHFYPAEKGTVSSGSYHKDFITSGFELKQESPEFASTPGTSYTSAVSRYTGRSPLMAGNARILTDKIKELPEEVQALPLVEKVLATANKYGYLMQGLTGFNLAFTQQKDSMQLPVGDPIAFSDFKQIYRNMGIDQFIAGEQHATPVADFDFNPIRAGGTKITDLELIDSFGLKYSIKGGNIAVPETLSPPPGIKTAAGSALPTIDAFFFPRFMQPVALRAQWLAAGQDTQGLNTQREELLHSNTHENPVCGWVVYSALYQGLMFFNAEGEHALSLVYDRDQVHRRQAPEVPQKPMDKYQQQFIDYLEAQKKNFQEVLDIISTALWRIDPAESAGHEQMALLFGRPLALVRMGLHFEKKGDQLYRMDHPAFKGMLKDSSTDMSKQYQQVEIPVRIGDYRKLNDGVILSWKDPKSWQKNEGTSLKPVQLASNSVDQDAGEGKELINTHFTTQALSSGVQHYGMLIDPRANIHISSGVVPVNVLRLPERYWKHTVQSMRINLRMGPLMFPQKQVMFNLPESQGHSWAWLQKKAGGGLFKTPEQQAIRQTAYQQGVKTFEQQNQIELASWQYWTDEQVLVPGAMGDETYAYINLTRLQKLFQTEAEQPSTDPPAGTLELYVNLFEEYGTCIDSLSRDPMWQQNELHEGWAQLYPDPQINKNE